MDRIRYALRTSHLPSRYVECGKCSSALSIRFVLRSESTHESLRSGAGHLSGYLSVEGIARLSARSGGTTASTNQSGRLVIGVERNASDLDESARSALEISFEKETALNGASSHLLQFHLLIILTATDYFTEHRREENDYYGSRRVHSRRTLL